LSERKPVSKFSPSICEAVFEQYTQLDDSLSKQIHKNRIEVRDFVILSFICDQDELSVGQISGILNLSRAKTVECIDRLASADLVQYEGGETKPDDNHPICATPAGRLMILRIHSLQD